MDVDALMNALAALPWGVALTDGSNCITFVNDRFADMVGYERAELIGSPGSMLRPPGFTPEASLVEATARGESWHAETVGRTKDGEIFWIALAVSPIFDADGNVSHYLSIAHDVTHQKRLQAHTPHAPLSPPDFLLVSDLDGTILFIDRTVAGLTREDAIGAHVTDHTPPEHHERLLAYMREVVDTRASLTYEIPGPGPYGSTIDYVVQVGPIERDGKVVALSFITSMMARVTGDGQAEVELAEPAAEAALPEFSRREMEVLELLARGYTNREVAAALQLSPRTVDHHVSSILAKLKAPNRTAAVVAANEAGIIQVGPH